MTQLQLDCQIARITGEPLSTINTLGFSLIAEDPEDLEPENVKLVLDCQFCRLPVAYPGLAGDGSGTLAECDRCDVYFEFDPDEVYTIDAARSTDPASPARPSALVALSNQMAAPDELVLNRSGYSGTPIRINTNRSS